GRLRMPSLLSVMIDAITSRVGVVEDENKKVLTPGVIGAGSVFVQSKLKVMMVGAMGLEGGRAKMKQPAPPAEMSTEVFRPPRGRLVAQFSAWKEKVAGRLVTGEMPQPSAVAVL